MASLVTILKSALILGHENWDLPWLRQVQRKACLSLVSAAAMWHFESTASTVERSVNDNNNKAAPHFYALRWLLLGRFLCPPSPILTCSLALAWFLLALLLTSPPCLAFSFFLPPPRPILPTIHGIFCFPQPLPAVIPSLSPDKQCLRM